MVPLGEDEYGVGEAIGAGLKEKYLAWKLGGALAYTIARKCTELSLVIN